MTSRVNRVNPFSSYFKKSTATDDNRTVFRLSEHDNKLEWQELQGPPMQLRPKDA